MHDAKTLRERLQALYDELEESQKTLAQIEEARRHGVKLSFDVLYLLGKLTARLPALREEIAQIESRLVWGE